MHPSRLLPALLVAIPAFAQVTVPATDVAGLTASEVSKVQSAGAKLQGKVIKLNFLCRGAVVTDTAGGGKAGEVLDSPTTRQKIDVEVPKEAVDWFMQLPTTYSGGPTITVYARLTVSKFGEPVAKILGREVKTDAAGTHIVW